MIRPRNGREKALKTSYSGICNYFHVVIILFHDVEIYFLDVKINSHVEKIVLKAFFLLFIRLFGLFCKASLCFFYYLSAPAIQYFNEKLQVFNAISGILCNFATETNY